MAKYIIKRLAVQMATAKSASGQLAAVENMHFVFFEQFLICEVVVVEMILTSVNNKKSFNAA